MVNAINNSYEHLKKQINLFKEKKGYTIKQIAELSELPESSVSKIFAGINSNPTIETIKKIAKVLDCTFDDLLDENENITFSPYDLDKETAMLCQEICGNDNLKLLVKSSFDLSPHDMVTIIYLADRLKQKK